VSREQDHKKIDALLRSQRPPEPWPYSGEKFLHVFIRGLGNVLSDAIRIRVEGSQVAAHRDLSGFHGREDSHGRREPRSALTPSPRGTR
jgi:hypothetical protein